MSRYRVEVVTIWVTPVEIEVKSEIEITLEKLEATGVSFDSDVESHIRKVELLVGRNG